MIEIRELQEKHIPAVFRFSEEIFGVSQEEKYSEEMWVAHLKERGLLLGAFDGDKIVGFKFGYQREPGTLHSWLGGVGETHRKRGIAQMLLDRQERWARQNGFEFITVNTIRDKFPAMYGLLIKNGYVVYMKSGDDENKSHFRKKLQK